MRARHRTSKLLLRQGIVYSGGTAWTVANEFYNTSRRHSSVAMMAPSDYEHAARQAGQQQQAA